MKTLTKEQIQSLANEFYTESIEDIVGLFSIAKEVSELTGGDGNNARDQTMRVVDALLMKGMQAGDPPYLPGGYKPWPNQDRAVIIDRIRSEWIALGRSPNIPDIAWFGPPPPACAAV